MDPERSTSAAPPAESRARFQAALPRLRSLSFAADPGDGIVFAGNAHESVPRRLFLDTRLTPLERNAWQVIRLTLNEDGVTAFPSYQELRPFLASLPGSVQASDETIARALTILRLTRWLSLARQRRDPTTGRIQGNLYVLHDEPLTTYEALALDPNYLKLVSSALIHASKSVQFLGIEVLRDFADDPLMSRCVLPSRLDRLLGQLTTLKGTESAIAEDASSIDGSSAGLPTRGPRNDVRPARECATHAHPISMPSSDSEDGAPSSDSEEGVKSLKVDSLRNPKEAPTVRTVQYENLNNNIRTVPRARAELPARFAQLRAEQQAGALAMLPQLDAVLQQAVLDEWDARCRDPSVRNPAGYLFGLIQRALRGQFRSWAARTVDRSDPDLQGTAPPRSPGESDSRRIQAQQHIAELKRLLALRR